MPHFVIHCSENVPRLQAPEKIMSAVHDTADATGLFKDGDIKVRIQTFENYSVGNSKQDFLHVFGYIMQGRTVEQRASLSKDIITKLKAMFPDVPIVSINISEFEKATYTNRNLI